MRARRTRGPSMRHTVSRQSAAAVVAACVALLLAGWLSPPTRDGLTWRLVAQETFDAPLSVDSATWTRDPQGDESPWQVDDLDDDGAVWREISGPAFGAALRTFDVYRKRVTFGDDGWLTAEIAAQDKDLDGSPDSQPGIRRTTIDGDPAALMDEPSWDAGVLIRPTRPLPDKYRVEVTLRRIDFGGERICRLEYDAAR